jgi:hypothetical protein
MTGLTLNPTVEGQIAALAGIDPAAIDPGSLTIALINPSGPTTIRYTLHFDVDTAALVGILKAAIP